MLRLNNRLESFAHLSEADRTALERAASVAIREVAPRRDLIREGERPRAVHVLLDGWACRYKTLPDGRRQIVAFLIPGDLFDLNIFILNEMDHNIGALTRARIASIDRDAFERLAEQHPRIRQALSWSELVSAAIQREWTLNIGQRSAYERIAHLLCETFVRLKTVGLVEGDSCPFPFTQNDIGDATGLTAVHVNRTMQELRRERLIELHSRRLVILDFARLRNAAIFDDAYLHLDRVGAYLDAND